MKGDVVLAAPINRWPINRRNFRVTTTKDDEGTIRLTETDRRFHARSAPGEAKAAFAAASARYGIDDRRFARARMHSSVVRVLRIGLPAGAVLLVFSLAIFSTAPRLQRQLHYDGAKIGQDGLQISGPTLTGATLDGGFYRIEAKRAVQDVADTGIIHLYGLTARSTDAEGTVTVVTADGGVFDQKNQLLDLQRNIRLVDSKGESAHLSSGHIDLGAGTLKTGDPVLLTSLQGLISARSMRIDQKNQTAHFEGEVHMTIYPDGGAQASTSSNVRPSQPVAGP